MDFKKEFETRIKEFPEIPLEDIPLVQKYVNSTAYDFTKKEVVVFEATMANNIPDRVNERFSKVALDKLAKTLVSKMRLLNHDKAQRTGRFYKANVIPFSFEEAKQIFAQYWNPEFEKLLIHVIEKDGGLYWLTGGFYMLNKTQVQQDRVLDVQGGIDAYTSIGFMANWPVPVLVKEGEDEKLLYYQFEVDKDFYATEGSGVYLGAQLETSITKELDEKHITERNKIYIPKAVPKEEPKETIKEIQEIEVHENKEIQKMKVELKSLNFAKEVDENYSFAEIDQLIEAKMNLLIEKGKEFEKTFKTELGEVTFKQIKDWKETADAYKEAIVADIVLNGIASKKITPEQADVERDKFKTFDIRVLEEIKAIYKALSPLHKKEMDSVLPANEKNRNEGSQEVSAY